MIELLFYNQLFVHHPPTPEQQAERSKRLCGYPSQASQYFNNRHATAPLCRFRADSVAKVFLPRKTQIFRAVGAAIE
jgi:hypothetical protein